MPVLTEDDIYRTSTQYRLWSFSPEALASLRSTTNATAADGVRAAILKLRSSQAKDDGSASAEVDCLTVQEEQRLVAFYCLKAIQFANYLTLPISVKVSQLPISTSRRSLSNALVTR